MFKKIEVKNPRRRLNKIAVLLLALLVAGSLAACAEEESVLQEVPITYDVEGGINPEATPVIVFVTPVDGEGTEAFAHASIPSEDLETADVIELAPGKYTLEFVSPINPDGSLYTVNQGVANKVTIATMDLEIDPDSTQSISNVLNLIPAEEVDVTMRSEIVAKINEAVESENAKVEAAMNEAEEAGEVIDEADLPGDRTLIGERGAELLGKTREIIMQLDF